jgi:hypothetical protein
VKILYFILLFCGYVDSYDARKRALTFLTPLPKDFEESCGGCTDFLGPYPYSLTSFCNDLNYMMGKT